MSLLDTLEIMIAVGGFILMMIVVAMITYIFLVIVTSPQIHGQESCEYDESLCVLGIPDPDFENDGFCNGNLSHLDKSFCDQLS